MTTAREEELFREFKRRPDSQTLTALLAGHQDHIYNIAFQVLRHPEDAEDVSQQALLETARTIGKINGPREFKAWLYKVALHSALKLKAARARRLELARTLAANPLTGDAAMDAEERAALLRAIGELDDRSRCVLLEHYFDKLTLEEIGAREGVSSVAVWKRLDRAKETLRRALLGAGFTVAAAGVAVSLESITPASAPAGLVGKLVAAGGVVVGTKSAVSAVTVVAALLLVGAASTGGYLVGAARVQELPREKAAVVEPAPEVTKRTYSPAPSPSTAPAVVESPPTEEAFMKGKPPKSEPEAIPETVTFGRPLRAKQDQLLKAATWDEFYTQSANLESLDMVLHEDLIFNRVARELDLDVETAQALRSLFDAEREETARFIVTNAGGSAAFAKLKEDISVRSKEIFDDWRRQRETVRTNHNPAYLKLLSYEQLAVFNDHLRNEQINLEVSYGVNSANYLVAGVGKPAK